MGSADMLYVTFPTHSPFFNLCEKEVANVPAITVFHVCGCVGLYVSEFASAVMCLMGKDRMIYVLAFCIFTHYLQGPTFLISFRFWNY